MNKSSSLDFCYKGDRMYVHGTDIYNKINALVLNELGFSNITDLDLSIHKIITHHLDVEMHETDIPDKRHDTAVVFSFAHNSGKYQLLLSENDQNVTCRYDYFEEHIVEACKVDKEKQLILLDSITSYTDIEVFTAMNKALLTSIYPDIDGKWLLSRFQTHKYQEHSTYNSALVHLSHNFNFRLTKSTIKLDATEVGSIYFSLLL